MIPIFRAMQRFPISKQQATPALTKFTAFLRDLRIKSTKAAWLRLASDEIATRGSSGTPVVPDHLRVTVFAKALRDMGFDGDPVLVAASIDRGKTGLVKYRELVLALSNYPHRGYVWDTV